MNSPIHIRPVTSNDLERLAQIEAEVWKSQGAVILSRSELAIWYEEQSPLFLVGEYKGQVSGYYFGRFINFSSKDTEDFIASERIASDSVHGRRRHSDNAKTFFGVSTVSTVPGLGMAMSIHAQQIWAVNNIKLCIGFTRLNGLNEYLTMLESMYGGLPYSQDQIALWYAHENSKLLSLRVWEDCPKQPSLKLPNILKPDPVFKFHSKGSPIGLLRVVNKYMPDIESRDYGALIASDPR
ncbi:MAG: hypothetical protein AB202_01890 [Parcubacteria bacterium C7867-007]|nr:MAG: hypothetical protein AB202_01890 [Parcubacteria bacterium C7867-007]